MSSKSSIYRFRGIVLIIPLLFLLIGCNLPGGASVPDANAVATAVQGTLIAQTLQSLEANQQAAQQQAQQQQQQNQGQQNQQDQQQQPPTLTFTPTWTPEPTFTHTPSVPMVSVSVDTNCRFGPGKPFELLGALLVGEQTEIIARDPSNVYWYVKNPDRGGFCWLWGYYATTTGDIASLPVFTPMPTPTFTPTPTPIIDFNVSFREKDSCGANHYVEFRLENIGSAMFQSVWVTVTNNDDAETTDITYEKFEEWDGCAVNQTYEDLDPGDIGFTTSNALVNDPTGKSFNATIKACTQPTLGGTCVTKTLNFTP